MSENGPDLGSRARGARDLSGLGRWIAVLDAFFEIEGEFARIARDYADADTDAVAITSTCAGT